LSGAGWGLRALAKRTGARVGTIQLAIVRQSAIGIPLYVKCFIQRGMRPSRPFPSHGKSTLRRRVAKSSAPKDIQSDSIKESESDQNFANILNNEYIDEVDIRRSALAELVKEQYNVDIKTALRFADQIHSALVIEGNVRKKTNAENFDFEEVSKRFETLLKNPPLYRNRDRRSEKPIEFYRRVWHEFAHYGLLYQDHLRDIDEQLINRVRHYCSVNHLNASKFLPPPRQVRTQREAALGDPKAIARLIATERIKAYRPK
jgi:hypothetical protein